MENVNPQGQSHVFEDQEVYQAPPELNRQPSEEELHKKQKTKKVLLIGILGLVIIFLVVVGLLVLVRPNAEDGPPVTPTPLPIQPPSNLEKELGRIKGLVEKADPGLEPFAPPPVDMEVEF